MTVTRLAAVAGVVALYLAQAAAFRGHASVTFDENFFLPAAKSLFTRGDFDTLGAAGTAPLPVMLACGPVVALHADRVSDVPWAAAAGDLAAVELARATNSLVVGVPLVLLCGGWVLRRTGSVGAAVAAGSLVALSPAVVAHSSLATTDAAFTLFFVAALAAVARDAAAPSPGRLVAAGALAGLAMASKYSAVLLLPVGYAVAAVAEVSDRGTPVGRRLARLMTIHPARQAGVAVVAFLVCWAVTGFALSAGPVFPKPAAAVPSGTGPRKLVGDGPLGDAVIDIARSTRVPAPVAGFLGQLAMMTRGPDEVTFPTYLFGAFHPRGHRLYYAWALLLKSTPAELVLLGLAAVAVAAGVRGGAGRPRDLDAVALAAGVGLLVLTCSLSAKQFGVRYVLPAYPAAAVLGVTAVHRRLSGRPRAVVIAVLVGWQAWSAAGIAPRQLSYFNDLAGGPDRGHERLGNSDVDWGQGLCDLKAFLDAHGEHAVVDRTFGAARPGAYGFAAAPLADPPACRFVAIGASRLHRDLRYTPELVPFRDVAPSAVVGHSVYIFDTADPAVRAAVRRAVTGPK
jgi:4-amino-4-deoxy-L-arabinose transferase-like glycosyltransferase